MNKSYLKWAGGKSRILPELLAILPHNPDRFIEPFVGSGTVAMNYPAGKHILTDLNDDLIQCHKTIQSQPNQVLNQLQVLYGLGRADYYRIRDDFNARTRSDVDQAAMFIYLNKHGFNGMCRYNRANEFNIPVGKSKTIHYPEDEIRMFCDVMAHAKFGTASFVDVFQHVGQGDVVYCDPPYTPASATLSDIRYTLEGFTQDHHQQLVDCAEQAAQRGARVFVSNHDTPVTRALYQNAAKIHTLEAYRSISSDKGTRGKVSELVAEF